MWSSFVLNFDNSVLEKLSGTGKFFDVCFDINPFTFEPEHFRYIYFDIYDEDYTALCIKIVEHYTSQR